MVIDQFSHAGGAQTFLFRLLRHWRSSGWSVSYAACGSGPLLNRAQDLGCEVVALPDMPLSSGRKSPRDVARWFRSTVSAHTKVDRAIAAVRPDAILVNGPRMLVLAGLVGWRRRVPVVAAIHNIVPNGPQRTLTSLVLGRRAIRQVVFPSDYARRQFASASSVLAKAFVIPNGVEARFLDLPDHGVSWRKSRGIPPDDLLVGVAGRLSEGKGQGMLMEAIRPLMEANRRIRLFFAGGSDFESERALWELEAALASWPPDVRRRVVLLGALEDLVPFFDALDVAVMPSRLPETYGLAAAEARARGRAVVVTDVGALRERVSHGQDGLCVPPSITELRAALTTLLASGSLRSSLGQRARARARAEARAGSAEAAYHDMFVHVGTGRANDGAMVFQTQTDDAT